MDIIPLNNEAAEQPEVHISYDNMNFQINSVLRMPVEFYWRGYVIHKGNKYNVYNLFYPIQKVMEGTFCRCGPENDEIKRLVSNGNTKELNNMRYYAHSHVDMSCNPSSYDLNEWKKTMYENKGFIVTAIFNKKEQYVFNVFDYKTQTLYSDVDVIIDLPYNFTNDNLIYSLSDWEYMEKMFNKNVVRRFR